MQSLIGQNIERYHILEQIGEGGMAVVYKALDSRLECNVAIKIIRIDNLNEEVAKRALNRFKNEAKILARLTHPNIVKVTDYGIYKGNPYLVMEYIPGGTLKEKMALKPFLPAEAVKILNPIAQALSYAHEQGVIHRDIKPSNILITESGEPMITDFGVAKVFDNELTQDVTAVGIGIGTPAYMSPEQGLGQKIDKRSDIYSLGVVFYELISGKQPYQADTPLAVVLKKINDPLPSIKSNVPDISDAVEAVIIKALSKEPDSRYANCKELVSAMERIVAEPISIKKEKASWILYPAIIVGILVLVFIYVRMAKPSNISNINTDQPISTTTVQSIEIASNIIVEDDFNDKDYDGSINNGKWIIVDNGGEIKQQNGMLIFTHNASPNTTIQLQSIDFTKQTITRPTYFSLKYKVIVPQSGHAFVFIQSEDNSDFRYECALGYGSTKAFHSCYYIENNQQLNAFPEEVDFAEWHEIRIEVYPPSMKGVFYRDGMKIGEFVPKNSDILNQKIFRFTFGLAGADKPENMVAFFDDVKIGNIESSPNPPNPTQTPALNTGSSSTNTTSEEALVIEDFNDSKIDMVGFDQDTGKWVITSDETGNKVFQVDNRNGINAAGFAIGEDAWRNYSVEYKLRIIDPSAGLGVQVRINEKNADIIVVSPNELYLAFPDISEWTRVVTKFPSLSVNAWHNLKIIVVDNSIKLFIDAILWVDEKSNSENGWVMFFADPGLFAQIDDIKVMEMKSEQNNVHPKVQILIDQSHQSFTADPDKAAQEQKINPDAINIVPMYQGLSDHYSVGLFTDPTYTKDKISNSQILLFPNTNGLFLTSEFNTLVDYLNEGNGILITGYSSSLLALIRELGIQAEFIGKPLGENNHLGWGPWGFNTTVDSSDQLLSGIETVTINAASALSVPNSQMVVLYSSDNSWVDENENQIKDTSETTGSFPLIIKAEIGEGRIIIMPAENVWGGFYIDNMKLIDNMIQWLLQ